MEATITLIDEFGKDVTVFVGINNITSIPDVVANACITQYDNSSILFHGIKWEQWDDNEYVLVDSRETVEGLVKGCVSGLLADTSRTLISEVVAGQYGGYVVMVIKISE